MWVLRFLRRGVWLKLRKLRDKFSDSFYESLRGHDFFVHQMQGFKHLDMII